VLVGVIMQIIIQTEQIIFQMQFEIHYIRFADLSPPELFPRVKNSIKSK